VASAQTLPPKKRQPTPKKVIAEHIAALNACDWNRMMAQYDDDTEFLSKDGNIVRGRVAIGKMFEKALMPPSKGGQCGMKLIPEHTVVVGDTVNVAARLCSRARAGEVLFSCTVAAALEGTAATAGAAAGSTPFLQLPQFELRGRRRPIDIWCVPAAERLTL